MQLESRVFSTPESGAISDRWTAVTIEGGDDLDEEGRAFMERYDLGGYPSLVAITAGGALLDRDLADGRLRDAAYLYRAMEEADAVNAQFLALRDRLLAAKDAESRLRLAGLYEERLELPRAVALYQEVFEEAPSGEVAQRALTLLARLDLGDEERALLDRVIERFPDAEECMGWRMRRATMHIPAPHSQAEEAESIERHVEALEGLRAELAAAGDVEGEATVRVQLARLEQARDAADAAKAQLDWVFEHAPEGRAARVAHLQVARQALAKRDVDTVRAHANRVLELAPRSKEAASAHMVLGDLAYGEMDTDAMETHFKAVIDLAPGSQMAEDARNVLEAIQRRRERNNR